MPGKRPAGELGLFRNAERYVPRDAAGRFTRLQFSAERKLIRKTAREMRARLGFEPAPILAEHLERNDDDRQQ
jgi:hypothetical protein